MKMRVFASRNRCELLRDPVSLLFSVGLPVVLLLLMNLIQRSTGGVVSVFDLERFTPGIVLFGMTFLSMFAAMLIAGDRDSSFLMRLFASPMQAADFLIGYCLPLLPLALAQEILCFLVAFLLGLQPSVHILWCLLAGVPVSLLFIAFGLLLGVVLKYKQVGPIASILVQVAALTSGMWFDLEMIGGVFSQICHVLPFAHALELMQHAMIGSWDGCGSKLLVLLGYTAAIAVAAVLLFRKKMRQ